MTDDRRSPGPDGDPAPETYLRAFREILNGSPVYRHLRMRAAHAAEGVSRIELSIHADVKNLYGTVHGGILAAVLDSSCGVAVASLLGPGETLVTVDLHLHYVRPIRDGTVVGEGKVVHRGRTTAVAEGTLRDGEGRLIAKGMATHFIQPSP